MAEDPLDALPRAEGGDEDHGMSLEQREALWGFTLPELRSATKVVSTLFSNPQLFVGDPYLAESRLYTMITRDRQTKRANKDVYKQVMAEEKTRRDRLKRQQDLETIRKTTMKREREEALNVLLQPSPDDGAVLLIEDRKEADPGLEIAVVKVAAVGSTDLVRMRVTAAFENICLLEDQLRLGPGKANQALVCHRTAHVFRFVPHCFGTQMTGPIVHEQSSSGAETTTGQASYGLLSLLGARQRIATLAATLPASWNFNTVRVADALRSGCSANASRLDVLFCALRAMAAEGGDGCSEVPQPSVADADELDVFIATRAYEARDFIGEHAIPVGGTKAPSFEASGPPDGLAELREAAEEDRPERERQYSAAFVHVQASSCGPVQLATPGELRMNRVQKCHTCKTRYQTLHPYYYSMCRPCGDYNYAKRLMTRDLRGKVVLLTGCRIKIGYAMAVSLLRCGAVLVGTTRFAHDAIARLMEEADYAVWKDRVHIYSLDLRDMWMVTQFCGFVASRFPKLFAIINNAAQTIARTPEYTARLRAQEAAPQRALRDAMRADVSGSADEWHHFFLENSSVSVGRSLQLEHHPRGDQPFLADGEGESAQRHDGNPVAVVAHPLQLNVPPVVYDRYDTQAEESDKRHQNSWTMRMHEVHGSEAAEVMAINALSPFVLNSKLKPLLMNRAGDVIPNENRFIINVSAMEGQFYRYKQVTHPHTNMAKAALNMMTRTSAEDYAKDGIYMNSVDTGWITDESPQPKKERRAENSMLCPLDEVDAAARCLDLIYTDSREYGKFWKDFHVIQW
jgi:NAD(P)-dependent dehydrogenase (short-subunit alcohol dehydrogenase family)